MNKETIKRNKATKITVYDAICGTGKSCAAITNIKDSTDRVVIITPLEDEMNRFYHTPFPAPRKSGIDEGSSWPSDGDHAYSCHMADRLQII